MVRSCGLDSQVSQLTLLVGVEIDIAPFKSLAPIREICDKVGLEINVL